MSAPKSVNEQLATIGAALALVGVLWGVAEAWFGLQARVSMLELEQKYSHGDIRPFIEGEKHAQ